MDCLDGVSKCVLGYKVKTRTQIVLTCLIPAIFELLVYISLVTADIAVAIQHIRDHNPKWAALTLTFLCLPALVCFCSVITSPWQWPEEEGCGKENVKFFLRQTFNFLCFPIGAIFRFCRRIFWSIESLFHEKDTKERHHATVKAAETSPFELYHFVQAFVHAGPQIMLQLYIMLRKDIFRNYETVSVQVMSIVFSFITMAIITSFYQRFESQKIVGRNYPWCTKTQITERAKFLIRTTSQHSDIVKQSTPISSLQRPSVIFEEVEEDDEFELTRKSLNADKFNFNEHSVKKLAEPNIPTTSNFQSITDDDKIRNAKVKFSPKDDEIFSYDEVDEPFERKKINRVFSSDSNNIPDDDLIENIDEIKNYIRQTDGEPVIRLSKRTSNYDAVPQSPPPPTPPETDRFHVREALHRFSSFKERMVLNTENYIKEHVPRLPAGLFEHPEDEDNLSGGDEVDFPLPTRRKMIEGIEQDDFIGKSVSFTGWVLFLIMRILSLSVFSVFYLKATLHLLYIHYFLMVLCLFYETKFHEKIERIYFYLFLGYIYIFSILEFKIKFVHVRQWYSGYVGFVFTQNIVISMIWYGFADFNSWWFHYLFALIIGSGMLSLACLLFYYFLLKPADKILFENENSA